MQLKAGLRLKSAVCTTEAMVVKAPAAEVDLRCGGHPMAPFDSAGAPADGVDPDFKAGSLLGKRYITEAEDIEILVTKAGEGNLSIGKTALMEKAAKKLPSSD